MRLRKSLIFVLNERYSNYILNTQTFKNAVQKNVMQKTMSAYYKDAYLYKKLFFRIIKCLIFNF